MNAGFADRVSPIPPRPCPPLCPELRQDRGTGMGAATSPGRGLEDHGGLVPGERRVVEKDQVRRVSGLLRTGLWAAFKRDTLTCASSGPAPMVSSAANCNDRGAA